MGDANLAHTGKALLATETRGAHKYWHMQSDDTVYPASFAKNKCAGMVWGDKIDLNTWFGGGAVFAHGINMIPFTPYSEAHLNQAWVKEEYPVVRLSLPPPSRSFPRHCFYCLSHVVDDPSTMMSRSLSRDYMLQHPPTDDWKGFIYMAHAVIEASLAWQEVASLTSFDNGNTRTNAMWWVATRP